MIVQCMKKGESQDEKRSVAEQVVKLLLESGYALKEVIKNHKVAVHWLNRDGTGVDAVEVHGLLSRICADGFAHGELGARWSFEVPSGDTAKIAYSNLVNASDGLLAPLDWRDVEVLAMATTHTVTAMNCVNGGTRGLDDNLSIDGRLNKDKIVQQFPSMAKPLEEGFEWVKIRAVVAEQVPELPGFLSDAANKSHGVHRLAPSMQCLLALHSAGMQNQLSLKNPMWTTVAKQFDLRRPDLKDSGADFCKFIDTWSGGVNPIHLKAIDEYNKMLSVKRTLPAKVLGQLATVPLTAHPEYIVAVVKAMLSSPDGFHSNGVSTLITPMEIEQMKVSKRVACMDAAKKMVVAEKWLQSTKGLRQQSAVKLLSEFQVNVVMTVHKRKSKARQSFESVDACCSKFVSDARKQNPDTTFPTAPWDVADVEEATEGVTPAHMREFTAAGLAMKTLAEKGVVEGAIVEREEHGEKVPYHK